MADGKGTISGMLNASLSVPKDYGNNPNHPGHSTSAFNKQKVPYTRPAKLQPDNAPKPDEPEPNPLTPLSDE
jgi:hypothetical protein